MTEDARNHQGGKELNRMLIDKVTFKSTTFDKYEIRIQGLIQLSLSMCEIMTRLELYIICDIL